MNELKAKKINRNSSKHIPCLRLIVRQTLFGFVAHGLDWIKIDLVKKMENKTLIYVRSAALSYLKLSKKELPMYFGALHPNALIIMLNLNAKTWFYNFTLSAKKFNFEQYSSASIFVEIVQCSIFFVNQYSFVYFLKRAQRAKYLFSTHRFDWFKETLT